MIKMIERAYRDLSSMGLEMEMNNATIISIIERILPSQIQNEWIELVTSKDAMKENKLPSLLKLLSSFKIRIEYKMSNLRFSTNGSETRPAIPSDECSVLPQSKYRNNPCNSAQMKIIRGQVHLVVNTKECVDNSKNSNSDVIYSPRAWCWIHNSNDHAIWKCPSLINSNVSERVNLLRQKRACYDV